MVDLQVDKNDNIYTIRNLCSGIKLAGAQILFIEGWKTRMSRKVIERNIAYDDEKKLYYVNMDYGRNWQGKRVKTAKTFKTKKEAVTALKVFEADKAKRTLTTPAGETMESFGQYWLTFEKADVRQTTKYTYSVTLNNHIIPYFKEKPLQKIGKEDIYKYFVYLRESKNFSANTIRKHYDMLCGIFSAAVQTEKIFTSPMKTVRAPRQEPFENQIYNPRQIVELFKAVDGDRTELAVHLAVYLGLRRGEICGLRWENVDLTNRAVSIVDSRTMAGAVIIDGSVKTDSSERCLKIPDGLMPALLDAETKRTIDKKAMGRRYKDKGYVFCYKNGKPYRPNYLSGLFSQMLERNGLPHIRFHDLRHTHGSIAILGAPLYDVSKSLGHSRQEMTQKIYIKDIDKVKSAAVDSVDGALKMAMSAYPIT